MAYQDRRKPFQGKQKHKDLREFKNQEIRKSLVHRARLRKNYFKLVENEAAPTDFDRLVNEQEGEPVSEEKKNQEDHENSEVPSARQSQPLPPQSSIPKEQRVTKEKRKPLNFVERAKLAKERKMQMKEEQLRKVQEKRRNLELSQKEREKKKLNLSQRTKTGQPVMGPKINDLLEKIKRNESY